MAVNDVKEAKRHGPSYYINVSCVHSAGMFHFANTSFSKATE